MSFTSPVFLLFLPLVVLVYRFAPGKFRCWVLLAASLLFYAWFQVRLLFLLLGVIVVTFFCGKAIAKARHPKIPLFWGCFTCLGVLGIFKYLDFLVGTGVGLANLLGAKISFTGTHILLPMGISFYCFQTMSYLVDVYRGNFPAEESPVYYTLFVTFFPQLVAGPIERPGDLLPQLHTCPTPSKKDTALGFRLLLRGYCKKLLIADYLAVFSDSIFSSIPDCGGGTIAVGAVLFGFQIYGDFSGYSDIAQGCGRLLGISLRDNFRNPYCAASVRDFWRRWHISLTQWFTDYVYIPLGGSRGSALKTCRNILITFLISGLWHGADWRFVLWGGLHGLYLILERFAFRNRQPGRILTFAAVSFAWIFFRSPSAALAFTAVKRLFTVWGFAGLSITPLQAVTLAALLLLLPNLKQLPVLADEHLPLSDSGETVVSALIYFLGIFTLLVFHFCAVAGGTQTGFLYFQF